MLGSVNRRGIVKAAAAVVLSVTLAQAPQAQEASPAAEDLPQAADYRAEDFADIPYRESEIGIDYHALADFPVDHMLSQGEVEWMENASEMFGDQTAETWGHYVAPEIGSGRVAEYTVQGMKDFTPKMLLSFARLAPNEPRYGILREAGKLFELEEGLKKLD